MILWMTTDHLPMQMFAVLPSSSDLCAFVVMIFGSLSLFAFISLMAGTIPGGWGDFAKHYRAEIRPSGNAYSALGCWWWDRSFSRYIYGRSRGLRVILTDAGIYFYRLSLSRVGHPPFLLPWASVKHIWNGYGILGKYYILEIEDAAGKFRLKLPRKIEYELAKYQKTGSDQPEPRAKMK